MERQKYFWNPLMDYWFRMHVEGWERIPESPALLIGIHSGAPLVWTRGPWGFNGGVTSAGPVRSTAPRTTR